MNRIFFLSLFAAMHFCFASDARLIKTVSSLWTIQETNALTDILKSAEKQGLAVGCLENKVREGIAKNKPAKSIIAAVDKRKTVLLAIVKDNGSVSIATQGTLLFETEKASSQSLPAVDHQEKAVLTIDKKVLPQQSKPDKRHEVFKGERLENQPCKSPSLQGTSADRPETVNEDKLDKRIDKQESKLDKIERKLEKSSARFKDKK